MPFIIRRNDQRGGFVAPAGSLKAYVKDYRKARMFRTRDEAEAERCPENERIEFVTYVECVG